MKKFCFILFAVAIYFAAPLLAQDSSEFDCEKLIHPFVLKRIPDETSFWTSKTEFIAWNFRVSKGTKKLNGGWRSELSDRYAPVIGQRIRYEFSSRFPNSFPKRNESIVVAQWHDQKRIGHTAQRPPLSLRVTNDQLKFILWNDSLWERTNGLGEGLVIHSQPLERERWIDFSITVEWLSNERGEIDIQIDKKDVAIYRGPIGYRADPTAPYFKIGLYTVHEPEAPIEIAHRHYFRSDTNPFFVRQN
jgi:hypothetical protein